MFGAPEFSAGFEQTQEGLLHDILCLLPAAGMLDGDAEQGIVVCGDDILKAERIRSGSPPVGMSCIAQCSAGLDSRFTYKTIERRIFVQRVRNILNQALKETAAHIQNKSMQVSKGR